MHRSHARRLGHNLVRAHTHHRGHNTIQAHLVSRPESLARDHNLSTRQVDRRGPHTRRVQHARLVCEVRPSGAILVTHHERVVPRARTRRYLHLRYPRRHRVHRDRHTRYCRQPAIARIPHANHRLRLVRCRSSALVQGRHLQRPAASRIDLHAKPRVVPRRTKLPAPPSTRIKIRWRSLHPICTRRAGRRRIRYSHQVSGARAGHTRKVR